MTKTRAETSSVHCWAERHIYIEAKFRQLCLTIYAKACAMYFSNSRPEADRFFNVSAANMAYDLGVDEQSVLRAYRELVRLGFFQIKVYPKRGRGTVYRVLNHDQWARKNPGRCIDRGIKREDNHHTETGAVVSLASAPETTLITPLPNTIVPGGGARELTADLTRLADNRVMFVDRHRERLQELLLEYAAKEIESAFSAWLSEQNFDLPTSPEKRAWSFVGSAADLLLNARKAIEERVRYKAWKEAAVQRLQAEAEANRQECERREREELADALLLPE